MDLHPAPAFPHRELDLVLLLLEGPGGAVAGDDRAAVGVAFRGLVQARVDGQPRIPAVALGIIAVVADADPDDAVGLGEFVAAGVGSVVCLHEMLPGPLGHDDDGAAAFFQPVPQ